MQDNQKSDIFARPLRYFFLSCKNLTIIGVSACAQLEIFVVKLGSICENKSDLDEKRIFINFKLSKYFSEAHRNISVLKIPLYGTNS